MRRSRALNYKWRQASKLTAKLRRRINKALAATGIPRARWSPSGRIKNMSHVSSGWESKSCFYFGTVSVELWKASADWPEKVTEALKPFKATFESGSEKWEVRLETPTPDPSP